MLKKQRYFQAEQKSRIKAADKVGLAMRCNDNRELGFILPPIHTALSRVGDRWIARFCSPKIGFTGAVLRGLPARTIFNTNSDSTIEGKGPQGTRKNKQKITIVTSNAISCPIESNCLILSAATGCPLEVEGYSRIISERWPKDRLASALANLGKHTHDNQVTQTNPLWVDESNF